MLLLAAAPAWADIYTWTDAQGREHFSDQAPTIANGVREVNQGRLDTIANPAFNLDKLRLRIPFEEVGGNMLVQARVNDVPMRFIVDTGASMVVIPPGVARRAGIATQGAPMVSMQTANGRVEVPRVTLSRLEVATVVQSGVDALVHKVVADEDTGLLGMNFLAGYRMSVDHDRAVLVLERR